MRDCRYLILPLLTLACAPPAVQSLALQPDNAPAVQVGQHEALIVFPPDPQTDFPWPAQDLDDPYAGPFWNFLAAERGDSAVSVAAKLGSLRSLALPAFPSLAAVVSQMRLHDCVLNTWIIACYPALRGTVTVDRNRVVFRVTDPSWLRRLQRQRPDSAWLRVDRPNRHPFWSERVPIHYLEGSRGA